MIPLRVLHNILWTSIWIWELHCTSLFSKCIIRENWRGKFLDIRNISYSLYSLFSLWHRLEFSKFFHSYYVLLLFRLRLTEQSFPGQYYSPKFTVLSCIRYSLNIKFYQIVIFPNFMHCLFVLFISKITIINKNEIGIQKSFYTFIISFLNFLLC